jgi:hypothetical protein
MADATAAVSPLRRRMIDDMSLRNLSPATQRSYPARSNEVFQPLFRPVAGQAGTGGRSCIPGVSGVAGHFLAGVEPDGLRATLLLRSDAGSGGDPGADRLCADATQAARDPERRRGRALSGSGAVAEGAHRIDYGLCRRVARLAAAPCASPRHLRANVRGSTLHEHRLSTEHRTSRRRDSDECDDDLCSQPYRTTRWPHGRTQNADGPAGHRDQHHQFDIADTDTGLFRCPKSIPWSWRRSTNPIARDRVSGFAQSGFNEVARHAKIDAHRRATSQKPPDSQRC